MAYTEKTIEDLGYDFTKIPKGNGEGYCTGKGVIPEPSDAAIEEYTQTMAEDARREATDGELTVEKLKNDMDFVTDVLSRGRDSRKRAAEAFAKMTNNHPTVNELMELPVRHFNGFTKYIQRQLQDPTLSTNDFGA
jgi:hypothetical protein